MKTILLSVTIIFTSSYAPASDLHDAINNKDYMEIQILLLNKDKSFLFKKENGKTVLHLAAEKKMYRITSLLLKNGAKNIVDAKDNEGNTALLLASLKRNYRTIESLIYNGADIGLQNNKGDTALHIAAKNGDVEISQFIAEVIDKDSLDSTNNEGNTALHIAFQNNEILIATILISHGLKKDVQNNEGKSPIDYSSKCKKLFWIALCNFNEKF